MKVFSFCINLRIPIVWLMFFILSCCTSAFHSHSSYKCSESEANAIATQYFSRGGHQSSRCPKLSWIETMATTPDPSCKARESMHMNILVVGGNKGFDCLGWARMFASRPSLYNINTWMNHLLEIDRGSRFNSMCGACNQCKESNAYPISQFKPETVKVYCVEPVHLNIHLIKHALKADNNTLKSEGTIEAVHAAIGLHVSKNGTVPFLDQVFFGQENLHILSEQDIADNGEESLQQVPISTIDTFIDTRMNGHIPEVLTIDTEGYDPLVILGAASALASGHIKYLEFEYHEYEPWLHINLNYIIDFLDNLGYDCFWGTEYGVLYRVTGCWDSRYESHAWSNIFCAHRAHPCWHKALLEHEYSYQTSAA